MVSLELKISLPADAYLEPCHAVQFAPPLLFERGIGKYIRDLHGDGDSGGVEKERQAEQRRVNIEGRQDSASGNKFINTREEAMEITRRHLAAAGALALGTVSLLQSASSAAESADQAAVDAMPHASLYVLEKSGHWPHVEEMDAYNGAVLRYLTGAAVATR